jgi:predicted RNA-binding Zn ribbon-like protein
MQSHYTGPVSALGSRVATLRLVGGRPCLDLVNTVSWRGDVTRLEDHLTDSSDCLAWCERAGVITKTEAHDLERFDVHPPLLALRETLTAHLVDADPPRLGPLQAAISDALQHSTLVPSDGRVAWQVQTLDARTPARRIALDLLDQLSDPPGPVRLCSDPACGWAYVDTSRGHRRRWCSSQDCGNRDRVRRHAARAASSSHRAQPSGGAQARV